jgi:phosphate transport system substrate-binding protein
VNRQLQGGLVSGLVSGVACLLLFTGVRAEQPLNSVRPVVDSAIASYQPKAEITGAIVVAGSDSMQPVILKAASAFKLLQPGIKIAVQGGGSDAALDQFLQNQSTIRRGDANSKGHLVSGHVGLLASSRPLTDDERKDFRSRYGTDPLEIPIALDAIAIYVNHDNPLASLTLDQADALFSQSRNRGAPASITTWGQLGLQNGWEQQPVRLYGRDKRSGTRTLFMHMVLLDGAFRSDVKEEPGSAMEIMDIIRDRLGIGYASIEFKASTVKILPIAAKSEDTPVAPTAGTAADGSYPLTRSLYLYAKRDPKEQLAPEIAEFLRFINSREGQETLARGGVYPLSSKQVSANLQALGNDQVAASGLVAERR